MELTQKSSIVDVDGCSLHYVTEGEGPPMILLHGLGASLATWQHNIDALAKFFSLYAFDLLGFGNSTPPPDFDYGLGRYAETLYKAVCALKIDRAHLVGSSFGGAVAALFSLRYPEKVHRLIVIGAVGFRAIASLNENTSDPRPDGSPGGNGSHELSSETVLNVLQSIDEKALEDLEKKTLLGRAVMIITGEHDPLIHREAVCSIIARNPLAKCLIIPDAHHLPHEDCPGLVNRNIISYCTQADSRSFCG